METIKKKKKNLTDPKACFMHSTEIYLNVNYQRYNFFFMGLYSEACAGFTVYLSIHFLIWFHKRCKSFGFRVFTNIYGTIK